MTLNRRVDPYLTSTPTPTRKPRRRWLETLLVAGFVGCLLIGMAAFAIFWTLYGANNRQPTERDPVNSIAPNQILPELALTQLAGDPPDALALQALNAGQLETGRTILTFSPYSDSNERISLLLQFAKRFADAQQADVAALLYHQIRSIAILDASLTSLERGDALTRSAEGLLAAGDQAGALDAARQAMRLGQQASDLLPAQRNQIFSALGPLADSLEDTTFQEQLSELARNPFLQASGTLPTAQLFTLSEPPSLDANLQTAIATREQRARELANRIAFTGGSDIDPERVALAEALLAEEQARGLFLSQMQQAGFTPGQQLWLLLNQRDWLLLRLRVAAQGFGLSLVPEWEANQATLGRELSAATNNLDNFFGTLANGQSEPAEQLTMRLEARRWLALQRELGLYTGVSPDELSQRLGEVQNALAQQGQAVAFPIAYEANATPPGFRIQARQ